MWKFANRVFGAGDPARIDRHQRSGLRTYVPLLLASLALLSCAERTVVAVDVAQVRVQPETLDVMVGDTVQLSVTLRDAAGNDLGGRAIAWSSSNTAIATVDASGRLFAHGPGTVRITASANGVTGEASATVQPAPSIGIQPPNAAFTADVGSAPPSPLSITVRNEGPGVLDDLGTSVAYGQGEPAGWLTASLSSPRAPADLVIAVSSAGLPAGIYHASVTVTSQVARPRERTVNVQLEVRIRLPSIQLGATAVSLIATAGGADPPAKSVSVNNGGGGSLSSLGTAVTYAAGQPTGWLSANISPTTAPTQLNLEARTGSLAPGRYAATVQVVSGVANNNPQTVAVSFDVQAAPPIIALTRNSIAVSAIAGGPGPGTIDVVITNSGGGTLNGLTASIQYQAGQPGGWLTTQLSSTSSPATLSVVAKQGSLSPGTYNATIDVAAATASNSPQPITVTFIISPAILSPAIALAPGALTFNAIAGGTNPGSQSISVTNSGGGSLGGLTVSVAYGSGQPTGWLTATLAGTSAPTSVLAQATTGALVPGTYDATISVSSPAAPNSPQVAAITFVVASAPAQPAIAVSPSSASFKAPGGGADPPSQDVSISNGGGGTLDGLAVSTNYAAGQPTGWLTTTLSATTAPATLTLQPATGTLPAGTYSAVVSVTSASASNSPRDVTVTFVVDPPPQIALSASSAAFKAGFGGPDPASQDISITNSGSGSVSGLGTTIRYGAGQPTGWLTATLSATTAPATLTLQPATGTLPAGTYSAVVSVTSASASNSPRDVTVTFVVDPPPQIGLSASSAAFNAAVGGPNPASQNISVTNSGGGSVDGLVATISYGAGQPAGWLAATLGATTAPTGMTLNVTTGSLPAGTYGATVSVTSTTAANSPQTVTVAFVVIAPPAAPSGLKANASGRNIDLTWKDNSNNETSFRVERSLFQNGGWSTIATLNPNTTSYRDSNVIKGITYYYRIFACNAAGCTVSNVVSEKP